MFQLLNMNKIPFILGKEVSCGCSFCRGKELRKDVKHYKLFAKDGSEFYLNFWEHPDTGIGEAEIVKKQ